MQHTQLPDAIQDAIKDYGLPNVTGAAANGAASSIPSTTSTAELAAPGVPSEEQLRALLTRYRGNVAAVGRELNKARMQIHRWMKRYGIRIEEYR